MSVIDDRNMRAQPLHNLQHMRGQKDRRAARNHSLQHRLQRPCGNRVHALKRLVEEQHLRPMDHRRRQRQLLSHPMRVIRNHLLRLVRQPHKLQQFRRPLSRRPFVEPIHPPHKQQVLPRRQLAKQRHPLRHHADMPLHLHRVIEQILAKNLY